MIEALVSQIEERFGELGRQMVDPAVIGDRQRNAEVGRAYSQLEPAARLAAEWRHACDDAAGAQELLDDGGEDEELRKLLNGSRERIAELEEQIRLAMVSRDPNDDKHVLVEIQGGAGGDEAGLWAGDVYRMLTRYAERLGFTVEQLELGEGKYTFAIKGDGAYSVFKFEGGTHRVQRVPATESQGRIHTSTATVAVLPEAEEVDVTVDPADLQIDVYRSSGPGGQSVNTTDSAVRVTHRPSGIVVASRTRSPSCRTGRRRCACCERGCMSARLPSSRRRSPPIGAPRSAPASAPRRFAPTTTPSDASPTTASTSPSTTSTRSWRASSTS